MAKRAAATSEKTLKAAAVAAAEAKELEDGEKTKKNPRNTSPSSFVVSDVQLAKSARPLCTTSGKRHDEMISKDHHNRSGRERPLQARNTMSSWSRNTWVKAGSKERSLIR
ncbi:hypothetical protein GGX14DRAFT_397577 [Mycena pura]|uniref:Uncharacterized protein n=1 Tax=Mycena pura TaxID=153505 RepID=A0AAD6V8T7_9AGAR|nr:hypothetical protein GGX14DRAFT_397577 [Mycena pura]